MLVKKIAIPSFGGFVHSYKRALFPEDYDIDQCVEYSDDIDNYISTNKNNTFQVTLFDMIDKRGLTEADVYNKVHIDRKLFSKIRNNPDYHPSKETVILIGISLELSERELEKLLDSASYSLPKNNHFDLIIRFCFMKSIYSISTINEYLELYHCDLLHY